MAIDKERKNFVCSLCHKSMNRKLSFERHKRNCVEKTKGDYEIIFKNKFYCFYLSRFRIQIMFYGFVGTKIRNFHPYQCPSPKMAQKSAGAFMESFQNRISDIYRLISIYTLTLFYASSLSRGRSSYHEVEEREAENSNSRPWSSMMNNIRNINFLHAHSQRKYAAWVIYCVWALLPFLPIYDLYVN